MRAEILAALALLLAPVAISQAPSGGGWTQLGGDPQHSRLAALAEAPLDVLASGRILEGARTFANGPFALQVPGGLATLGTTDNGGCVFSILPEDALSGVGPVLSALEGVLADCPGGARLVGSAPHAGVVFACWDGAHDTVELRALDAASFDALWSAGLPAEATTLPGAPSPDAWACHGVVEEDRVVVVFSNDAQNVFAAYDLVGRTLWTSAVRAAAATPDLLGQDPDLVPVATLGFSHVTRAQGGYFLYRSSAPQALAWFDDEGEQVAAVVEGEQFFRVSSPPSSFVSARPTAQGEHVLAALEGYAMFVRATDLAPAYVTLPEEVAQVARDAIWWRDLYVLPSANDVVVLRTPDMDDPWTWKAPRPTLLDTLVTPAGDLIVLSRTGTREGFHPTISRLDLSSRAETQRLDLPVVPLAPSESLAACIGTVCDGKLVPLANGQGLVVLLRGGQTVVLGIADEARLPRIAPSTEYPAEDALLRLSIEAPVQTARIRVAWGDGTFEDLDVANASAVEHAYTTPGTRTIRVTAYSSDGRTGTRALPVHVGAAEPQRLSAIQRAFSPDNQELTFFLIGLALTGGGALFAALLRRQRHSRLAEEERKLRAVIDASLLEPTKGLAALEAHRAHLRDEHTRRRLDDAQYGLLDARAVRAMKSARYRLLGPALNRLSPHFRRLLDTALEDGQVTSGEMAALVAALADERALEDAERERLRALLARWAR